MLGFRGCRLGVVYPEISEMQARAVFQAALNVSKKGIKPIPELEIPNIISLVEFKLIIDIIKKVAQETGIEKSGIKYKIGTMIEFPRAAMVADELAKDAEFMSFGTNDLTQTTLGFSRDDAGRFIPVYVEKNVFEKDPFQTIDQEGVGKVMKMAVSKARSVKPNMDIGICGEHGGDPASVKFCHKIGLSNVSCSPFRVPIATLAAAQAVVESRIEAEKNRQIQKQPQQNNKSQQTKINKPNQSKNAVNNNLPKPQQKNQPKNKSPNQQKPQVKQAISIQDEIRKIVRQELSRI
jgi:pyruvate,orthophosphate dikinase